MKRLPIIVCILGYSNTGKTGFIEAAIRACARRGIAAAAVKKSRHTADLEPQAKDSDRFFRAGAAPSIYLGEEAMLVIAPQPNTLDAPILASLCPGAEVVFCEGLEIEGATRVLAAGSASSEAQLKRPLSWADALLGGAPALRTAAAAAGLPAFAAVATVDTVDTEAFLDWLLSRDDRFPEGGRNAH